MRVLILILAVAAAPAMAQPTGLWLSGKKALIVNIYECGEALCGRTVWMKKMFHKSGEPRLDAKNPDPALRDRHWCGIEVITGLRPDGEGEWDSGEVYDPKTGQTFSLRIEERGDRLKMRGYLGLPIFGKTEMWTRTDGDGVEFCTDGDGA